MKSARVGLVGCGQISGIYLKNARELLDLEVAACADLDLAKAGERAAEFGIPNVMSVEELLENADVDVILNLTVPAAHAEIALQALQNGKSVYNEKPLAVKRREAREMIGLAREKGLRIGCAPDTFLGAGLQTVRKLLDAGEIGVPIGAVACLLSRGPESWHANPEFFYKKGGGPLFDMGPYYLSALASLLGPVESVCAVAAKSFAERTITSAPKFGEKISVETPTHHSATLQFSAGVVGTMIMSFDVHAHNLPRLEIYGSEGTLVLPDPNTFGGPVRIWRGHKKEWEEVPLVPGFAENSRGIGLADMVRAMRSGEQHRCNEALAYHVLEIMHAVLDSSDSGRSMEITSTLSRPEPLEPDLLRRAPAAP